MRIRRKTWARPELAACPYYIPQPEAQKGHWQEVFSSPGPSTWTWAAASACSWPRRPTPTGT